MLNLDFQIRKEMENGNWKELREQFQIRVLYSAICKHLMTKSFPISRIVFSTRAKR